LEGICREDLLTIKQQIGRWPKGITGIVRRCRYGYPVLIQSCPVIDEKPFPTLYWLTCPYLVKAVSRLESQGWIHKLEERIACDLVFKERYLNAHKVIRERRARLINDENIREKLDKVGSGGIKDLKRVKCLHLHLSDYLAGVDNPIGEAVLREIGTIECEPNEIMCK